MKKIGLLYPLFAATIFLGSFLLFQVQPIIGKYILPWFGGTSFVWITSLLFFQTLLLGGYYYAFLLNKISLKKQGILHLLLIIFSIGLIFYFFHFRQSPITPSLSEKPSDNISPGFQVLIILFISVGLPYFLLSSTSTLLQRWFSFFTKTKSPYSLYAISNVGSLLGLVSYPFFVEPIFSLKMQGNFWSECFILVCFLLFLCVIYILKSHKNNLQTEVESAVSLTRQQILLWTILPGISSLMLLAATSQMTQAIAPIPFLWLLPLCLYLISFIVCFSKKNLYQRTFFAFVFLISMLFVVAILLQSLIISIFWQLILYSFLLFSAFMLCHGELYAQKPTPHELNKYYLLISFGSVIGALIVAIIAPLIFVGLYWEMYLGLYATTLVAVFALVASQTSFFSKILAKAQMSRKEIPIFLVFITSGLFLVIAFFNLRAQISSSVGIWRNFYGTQRVTRQQTDSGILACLLNGKIIHGCQFQTEKLKTTPITYFGKGSGVDLAMQSLRKEKNKLRIGIIGLGVGTIAAYGQPGDNITFYELNPQDIEIAQKQFSYLSDSRANIEIKQGDGRLSVEKQMQQNGPLKDNLFVIDAFNDDAIPVHLLTKEAFDLYRHNITPNSIIAVHISTTYIDLTPVIVQLARHFNMHVAVITTQTNDSGLTASRWALLSDNPNLLQSPSIKKNAQDLSKVKQTHLWTDDFSNVFQLVRY